MGVGLHKAPVILSTIITLYVLIHDPSGLPRLSPLRRALLSHFLGLQRRNLLIEALPDSWRPTVVKEKKAGDSKRGTAQRPSKLERTTYHEAGHVVTACDRRRLPVS